MYSHHRYNAGFCCRVAKQQGHFHSARGWQKRHRFLPAHETGDRLHARVQLPALQAATDPQLARLTLCECSFDLESVRQCYPVESAAIISQHPPQSYTRTALPGHSSLVPLHCLSPATTAGCFNGENVASLNGNSCLGLQHLVVQQVLSTAAVSRPVQAPG